MPRATPFYFISGGCRSGKSRLALSLAEYIAPSGLFIATASAVDLCMEERINAHKAERSSFWGLYEVPFGDGHCFAAEVKNIMEDSVPKDAVILLDCLTLWVSNCMENMQSTAHMRQSISQLIENIYQLPNNVIIVSNEVGLGVVPPSQSGGLFRDLVGLANQFAASKADHAIFTVSGLPLVIKGSLPTGFTI